MAKIMNIASFILSMVSLILFSIYMSAGYSLNFLREIFGFHPLTIILAICILALIPGLLGLAGAPTWKGKVRSILTLTIIVCLSTFLTIVVMFERIIQST